MAVKNTKAETNQDRNLENHFQTRVSTITKKETIKESWDGIN